MIEIGDKLWTKADRLVVSHVLEYQKRVQTLPNSSSRSSAIERRGVEIPSRLVGAIAFPLVRGGRNHPPNLTMRAWPAVPDPTPPEPSVLYRAVRYRILFGLTEARRLGGRLL